MKCLVPDLNDSEAQCYRFYHWDIPNLDDNDIMDEVHALRPLLWWKLEGDDWLQERVRMLEAELAKRRLAKRQGVRQ